jgi:hypothetical protein
VAQVLGIGNGAPITQQLRKLAREREPYRALRNEVASIADERKRNRHRR